MLIISGLLKSAPLLIRFTFKQQSIQQTNIHPTTKNNNTSQPVLDKSGGLVAIATKYFPLATKNAVFWLSMRGGG